LSSPWVRTISDVPAIRSGLRTELKNVVPANVTAFRKNGEWFENYYTGRKNGKKTTLKHRTVAAFRKKLQDKDTLLKNRIMQAVSHTAVLTRCTDRTQ
jgi:ribosomal protein L25 (general stress protein Ctc)